MRNPLLILTGTLLLVCSVFFSQFGVYRFIEEIGLPESSSPLVFPPSLIVPGSALMIFLGLAFLSGWMGWNLLKRSKGNGAAPFGVRPGKPKRGLVRLVLLVMVTAACVQFVRGRGNLTLWYSAVQKRNQDISKREKYVRDHLSLDPKTNGIIYFQAGKSCYGFEEYWIRGYDLQAGAEVPLRYSREDPEGEGGRELYFGDFSDNYFAHSITKVKWGLGSIACSPEGTDLAAFLQNANSIELVRLDGFGRIDRYVFKEDTKGEPIEFATKLLPRGGTRAWIKRSRGLNPGPFYTVELWDLEQAKSWGKWDLPKQSVLGSDGSGNYLYLLESSEQGGSGKIKVLDSAYGREICSGILEDVPAMLSQSGKLAGSSDGKSFAFAIDTKVKLVRFEDADKPTVVRVFDTPGQVRALRFGSDGKAIGVFSRKKVDKEWLLDTQDATIQLLQVESGEQKTIPFQVKPTEFEDEINFDEDLGHLTFRASSAIHRYEVATGRELIKGKSWK